MLLLIEGLYLGIVKHSMNLPSMQEDGYREGAVKTFFDYASLLDERDVTLSKVEVLSTHTIVAAKPARRFVGGPVKQEIKE